MAEKILKYFLFPALFLHGLLHASDIINLEPLSEYSPPENYPYRIVEIVNYRAEVVWNPELEGSERLSCREEIVIRHLDNLDAALLMAYGAQAHGGIVDSARSNLGINSLGRYADMVTVDFAETPLPGTVDTLVVWFRNSHDQMAYEYPGMPGIKKQYYAITNWCPFPLFYEGLFTIDKEITAPDSLDVVAQGREIETDTVDARMVSHRWKTSVKNCNRPIFVIDKFEVDLMERDGIKAVFFHRQRPDSTIARLAEQLFDSYEKYLEWYGPIDFSIINLVELYSQFSASFAEEGVLFLHEALFGGKPLFLGYEQKYMMLLAHELAHQWWADRVLAVGHRKLLEAFAEFSAIQALFSDNPAQLKNYLRNFSQPFIRNIIESNTRKGEENLPLADEGGDPGRFYHKGPWVLYMLEQLIGRESFLRALADMQREYKYREASLDDFFAVLSGYYNEDLGWFRRQWFEKGYYPVVEVQREFEPAQDGSITAYLIFNQKTGELFNIPLEIGVYFKDKTEIERFWIANRTDTLILNDLSEMPDSLIVDPFVKTLIDVTYNLELSVALHGDTPNRIDDYSIDFFVDRPAQYSEIKIFYLVNDTGRDSIIIDPMALSQDGYGSVDIPAQPAGSKIEYYLSARRQGSLVKTCPTGAPDSVFSFKVTVRPQPENELYVMFRRDPPREETLRNPQAFPDQSSGILGINSESLQSFGKIYSVGEYYPQIDSKENLLITCNKGHNAVDVIDIGSWRRLKRILLPDSLAQLLNISAYNPGRQLYYLMTNNKVFSVDLQSGQVKIILNANLLDLVSFYFLPRQMVYYGEKDFLMVKNGSELIRVDGSTDNIIGRHTLHLNEMSFLKANGTIIGVQLLAEMDEQRFSGEARFLARTYRTEPDFSVEDSTFSRFISLSTDIFYPYLSGSDQFDYSEKLNTLVFHWSSVSKHIIWHLSAPRDTLIVLDLESWPDAPVTILQNNSKDHAVFVSSSSTAISIFDLESLTLKKKNFSPFTGREHSLPGNNDYKITGIIAYDIYTDNIPVDPNADGKLDILDLVDLLVRLGGESQPYELRYDLNNDGKVNIFDIITLLLLLQQSP